MSNQSDRRYLQTIDPFILDDLRQMQNAPNYNKWLYEVVKPFIGKRVLEIGSGIGNMSRKVIEDVDLLVGIEPNEYCANLLLDTLINEPRFIHIQKKIEDCDYEDLKKYQFDTILCMNVLEHIADDVATLKFFEKILEPGGRVVLLVPAIPQAYGPIDKAVGHFRRYTKSSIREVLGNTSMKVEILFYSNLLGLLGWLFNARISKSINQNNFQIKLFDTIVPLLSFIEDKVKSPIGLSLICVSRKK